MNSYHHKSFNVFVDTYRYISLKGSSCHHPNLVQRPVQKQNTIPEVCADVLGIKVIWRASRSTGKLSSATITVEVNNSVMQMVIAFNYIVVGI